MQRYILDDNTNTFYKSDLHHIKNVMRFNDGDEIIVCLKDICYKAKLNFKSELLYDIFNVLNDELTPNITLVQGLIKGNKVDVTIKYATIFGATKIILVPFERSIAKNKNSDFKKDRLFSIAKEATELSHRKKIPQIDFFNKLSSIDFSHYDYIILADEEEKEILINDLNLDINKKICIVIGPEGGISENERNWFKTLNCHSISLGKYIFPAEIAAINVLSKLI